MSDELDSKTGKTCSCGNKMGDSFIQHKCEYSSWGWVLYWIGMSAKPIRVDFYCMNCGDVIYSTSEPEVMKQYVGR